MDDPVYNKAYFGNGEYENLLKNRQTNKLDETARRLLSAMQLGILIHSENGHRWIISTEHTAHDAPSLDEHLEGDKLPHMRSKVYGTIYDALDRIDGALQALGRGNLLEHFDSEAWL